MKQRPHPFTLLALLAVGALLAAAACSSSTATGPAPNTGPVGQECTSASQCYGGIDAGSLLGQAACLNASGGYCTHTCTTDADCCAVAGECPDRRPEVCGPFQSEPSMYCLLSCETTDLADAGIVDANVYCATYANPNFTCRSSGGGSSNRKICAP